MSMTQRVTYLKLSESLCSQFGTFLLFGPFSHVNELLLYVTKDGLQCRAYHYLALQATCTVSNMPD